MKGDDGIPKACFGESLTQRHTLRLEFDEQIYRTVYDDVNASLESGKFINAREHFDYHGKEEGRLTEEKYIRALGLAAKVPIVGDEKPFSIDTIVCCGSGTSLIVGWIDDRDSPLMSLSIFVGLAQAWNTTAFGRIRRTDVESLINAELGHSFGFWAVAKLGDDLSTHLTWTVRGRLSNGCIGQQTSKVRLVREVELRDIILGFLSTSEYFGNRDIESVAAFDSGIGEGLIKLNRQITSTIATGAWVSYYGLIQKNYAASIIICLYGKLEFIFLQSAIFSLSTSAQDYEFIYVCNSPELTESLQKEAWICARIYGVRIVLVCLPDNAGFGAANNIAARVACSKRLMIVNPDVFPRDSFWAHRHADIIASVTSDQSLLFGAPLYYDDGSLMHHGIYFEIDTGISLRPGGISVRPMIRAEHYGKGSPAWSRQFICPRPVPAVTGAFISVDRDWFETLGGFNEDFLFGHYEDLDLSLTSLTSGQPVWIHDFPMWHMEGKGSIKRREHEGGSLVNRWLFSRKWGELVSSQLLGPEPVCPALRPGYQRSSGPE